MLQFFHYVDIISSIGLLSALLFLSFVSRGWLSSADFLSTNLDLKEENETFRLHEPNGYVQFAVLSVSPLGEFLFELSNHFWLLT